MSQKSTPTLTNVASSASSVTLFSAVAEGAFVSARVIFNDSSSILYVKFGVTASVTSFTYKLNPGDTLELPHPVYDGLVTGIWATANGAARVTEVAS